MERDVFYSPLNFFLNDLMEPEKYNGVDYWRDELSQEEAFEYLKEIKAYLARDRADYDNERGLAEYISDEALKKKVHSIVPDIGLHGGKLFLVTSIQFNEPLTEDETLDLKDYITGQLSDGWGESLEQHEIKVPGGELYIEPWDGSDDFFIDTSREFAHRIGIPELEIKQPEEKTISAELFRSKLYRGSLALVTRIEKNLQEFTEDFLALEKEDIFGNALKISAVQCVYEYLTEEHEFSQSELDYLLIFENPLQVVAKEWPGYRESVSVLSDVMDKVFEERNALSDDAHPKLTDPAILDLRERLDQNLRTNLKGCMDKMLEADPHTDSPDRYSEQAVNYKNVHSFLTDGYDFRAGDIKRMLQMNNPLEFIASRFGDVEMASQDRQELVQRIIDGEYEPPLRSPAPSEKDGKGEPVAKKSVIEQLREARETSTTVRDISEHSNNNPEL